VTRLTRIQLSKEYLKFSAAHFTIFSASERERLHGHNFAVAAEIIAPVGDNGLCFSYGDFKAKLELLCQKLDEYLILPGASPHLKVAIQDNRYEVRFADEFMSFLVADTLVLPIRNTTVEEFSAYLLEQLLQDPDIRRYQIERIELKVSSGPGQWGSATWENQG
jgi:6-pyruvoyltetrahydropterin/6-carboxytetrahydropterin synthase